MHTTYTLSAQKAKENLLQNEGIENVFQRDSVKKKLTQTKIERYGSSNFTNRDKAKQTCFERYGAETYLGSLKNANLYFNTHDCSDEYIKCFNDKEYLLNVLDTLENKTSAGLGSYLGIPYGQALHLLGKHGLLDKIALKEYSSQPEYDIINYVGSDLCVKRDRTAIAPYEIDIYIPSKKIGIEFNGTYWHSSIYKEKDYHFKKSRFAEKAGIRLIHI